MKYCLNYRKASKYKDTVDELLIRYNNENPVLSEFLEAHKNQRTIIEITNKEDCLKYKWIDKFFKLKKEHPDFNYAIKLPRYEEDYKEYLESDKKNVDIFFQFIITDWEVFRGYCELNVSDIYIGEQLGFELDKVAAIAHQNNKSIRIFPDVCQRKWNTTPTLKSFFIRPEDLIEYEPYIDVLEFWKKDNKEDVYYEIYQQDSKWFGNLKEIISDLNEDLDSRFVIPRFGQRRLRCGRKCLRGEKCNLCGTVSTLAKSLEKAGLIVTYRDKDNKKEERLNGKRSESESRDNGENVELLSK